MPSLVSYVSAVQAVLCTAHLKHRRRNHFDFGGVKQLRLESDRLYMYVRDSERCVSLAKAITLVDMALVLVCQHLPLQIMHKHTNLSRALNSLHGDYPCAFMLSTKSRSI